MYHIIGKRLAALHLGYRKFRVIDVASGVMVKIRVWERLESCNWWFLGAPRAVCSSEEALSPYTGKAETLGLLVTVRSNSIKKSGVEVHRFAPYSYNFTRYMHFDTA